MSEESRSTGILKEGTDERPRESIAAGKQSEVKSESSSENETNRTAEDAKSASSSLTGNQDDSQVDIENSSTNRPLAELTGRMKLTPSLAEESTKAKAGASIAEDHDASAPEDVQAGLARKGKSAKDMASYKFWGTQPVPKFGEEPVAPIQEGPIKIQKLEDVPKQPPALISGFEWDFLDLTDKSQLDEVYDLLSGHFVEDDGATFRLKYSTAILKWAMMSPGWKKQWHRGVRATQSKKLVAFIAANSLKLKVHQNTLHASEVNFMVVHKKLRSKRLAPVLIKEITRLCNLDGVWQAIYTGGNILPKPVSTCRYFHRPLNWQKLWEVGFSYLPSNSTPQYQVRKYAMPSRTAIRGLRKMKAKDVKPVHDLLMRYLKRFDLYQELDQDEVEHWFVHKKDSGDERAIHTYVVENSDKKITDFFSFYSLDSTVIGNHRHQVIRAAYLFYYATEVGLTSPMDKAALKSRLNDLMSDALILAQRLGFDVMNALSLMDNALFLEEQIFGPGDGDLHYYLFNYFANPIAGGVDENKELDVDGLSGLGYVMM